VDVCLRPAVISQPTLLAELTKIPGVSVRSRRHQRPEQRTTPARLARARELAGRCPGAAASRLPAWHHGGSSPEPGRLVMSTAARIDAGAGRPANRTGAACACSCSCEEIARVPNSLDLRGQVDLHRPCTALQVAPRSAAAYSPATHGRFCGR